MMREFIDQERQRLQDMFDVIVVPGGYMRVYDNGVSRTGEPFFTLPIATLVVTRVQPEFDAAGNHTRTIFWIMWNGPGYDDSYHHTRTIRVAELEVLEPTEIILRDKHYWYFLDVLLPDVIEQEREMWDGLMAWRELKAREAERFATIDAQLLAEHREMANTWQD